MKATWKGLTVGVWLLAALTATVWAELDSRLDEHWEQWKKTHQRKYQNEVEELGRRVLWEKNVMQIIIHNLGVPLGLHTYTMGINHLSDMTESEMLQFTSPLKMPQGFQMTPTPLDVTDVEVPLSVDWTTKGYVTSVKNQGSCGSCYTFSAVGALEGLWAKTTGQLVDLSPQNLVDCSNTYGNAGCGGGWMHEAFQYVIDNDGIDSEASYPYEGVAGECRYNRSDRAANCSSYHFVPEDELSLKHAVGTIGPVSVAIDSSTMSSYSSGVYYNKNCGQQLNHAVLAVGYGTDSVSGLDYWLIKNSWGTGWGENGYIKLARNQNQMCGISTYSVYPQ